MKRCFVIMPYGGDDISRRKHYEGIYQSLITPAAMRAGYEPKRSDLAGEPGNITHDIIKDLADSDMVIADLTEANANVFFELGIRHAFRKSGTVHIVDQNHPLPFDIRHYRAIPYSTDLSELPDVIANITTAIKKREEQPMRADNPVHDAIPSLPADIRNAGEAALVDQIEELQSSFSLVQEERDALRAMVSALDPTGSVDREKEVVDVDAFLDEADVIMRSTGEHVLLGLTSAGQSSSEEFVKMLREVLKNPFLGENDFAQISNMCIKQGLPEHRRAVLEVAHRRFPGEDDFLFSLADCYDDSPSAALKERGRLLVEEFLHVKHTEEGPVFVGPSNPNHLRGFGVLFDAYRNLGRHDWILTVIASAERLIGPESLFVRNKASALSKLGRAQEAEAEFKRALENDPGDDTAHLFYSGFLSDHGRYKESYEEHELTIVCDPDDPRGWSSMAIEILNHGYVRDASGTITGPVQRRIRLKYAFPLLQRALGYAANKRSMLQQIITILVRADAVDEATAISQGTDPPGEYETSAEDYIDELIREH